VCAGEVHRVLSLYECDFRLVASSVRLSSVQLREFLNSNSGRHVSGARTRASDLTSVKADSGRRRAALLDVFAAELKAKSNTIGAHMKQR